ncbi:hypothetical protein PR003_g30220 [Phytophthora rubi]|uniref:Uncharacterized protein n=1 Tax=Phytophthora rubi TaxID=129364 RepID=A0A6A3H416_9STRA|nr:hypothetical protein PR002_g29255 [Phytophthora rubi]KAE8964430.1 hypothetical protein PR001_g29059 [Phytophthora rubi]KAE9272379.1 hypothetical protein PR003_g30220 [Phytophthora rubi]
MLLVVSGLPSAVAAAQMTLWHALFSPSCTMTLPLPPAAGPPRDPPSKKPIRTT